MDFWVSLIKVSTAIGDGATFLINNCTNITNNYFFYEGWIECLDDEKIDYIVLSKGVVESLGGLSKEELIKIALNGFDIPNDDRILLESILEE